MSAFSFFNKDTGLFTGRIVSVPDRLADDFAKANPDCIAGRFDRKTQRLDLQTMEIVPHQYVNTRLENRMAIKEQIEALMRKLPRAQLEHSLSINPAPQDRQRGALTIQEIQSQLESLRTQLRNIDG